MDAPRPSGSFVVLVCAPLLAASLGACSDSGTTQSSADATGASLVTSTAEDLTLLVSSQSVGDSFLGVVSGTLDSNDQGCITIAGEILIAPEGSTLTEKTLSLPGYAPATIGEDVEFGGGHEEVSATDAGAALGACLASGVETARYAVVAPGDA